MALNERVGSAELEQLAEAAGDALPDSASTSLEGLICRTSTALVFVARGGVFGAREGVMKLTGPAYAPLLERELRLLNACRDAQLSGIVRPVRDELEWLDLDARHRTSRATLLLPFLGGGDLVQWIGAHDQPLRAPGRATWRSKLASTSAACCATCCSCHGRSCIATSSRRTCCSPTPARR